MPPDEPLRPAFDAIDDSVVALTKLDKTCCVPGRSPRMAALAETIESARQALIAFEAGSGQPDSVTKHLEDAGGQIGRLQIGCCAPDRLPLYTRMLGDLTTAQLVLAQARGLGH